MTPAGLPHWEIPGSSLVWQLPEAYRSLPRPSSPPGTKASTVCPYFRISLSLYSSVNEPQAFRSCPLAIPRSRTQGQTLLWWR